MREDDIIKKKIVNKLKEKCTYLNKCVWCGKPTVRTSETREMIHHACWLEFKFAEKVRSRNALAKILQENPPKST